MAGVIIVTVMKSDNEEWNSAGANILFCWTAVKSVDHQNWLQMFIC